MLIQSKGNRFSIGSYFDNKMRPFTNQETDLQPGDVIYLFTDGYPDQFGGENDRKMSHRRFRELLMEIHQNEMNEQKKLLEEQLNSWMKGGIQTDDICVIGIRIK
jgi:serine phosphatase RsbU (regulator of sigma subunit)